MMNGIPLGKKNTKDECKQPKANYKYIYFIN